MKISIGTLLMPNKYNRDNGISTSGIIVDIDKKIKFNLYKVLLIPYNYTRWLDEDVISNLFEVIE